MNDSYLKRVRWMLLACTLPLFSPALLATEGYKETSTGVTVLVRGYSNTSADINSSPSLTIDVNRQVQNVGRTPAWLTLATSSPDITQFVANINVAIGLWENMPNSRINLRMGAFRSVSAFYTKDNMNLALMAGGTYTGGGSGGGHLETNSKGIPEIVERDFRARRSTVRGNITRSQVTTVHEIGHTLGFNHSYLSDNAVTGITSTASTPSVMSYGARNGLIRAGALGPDDVALAARIFPRLTGLSFSSTTPSTPTLSRSTGAVQGKVVTADGGSEVYGANVLLVDTTNGDAVLSRISGYATSRPNGTKTGTFDLDGVPPGTYDVLVAPIDDGTVVTSSPIIHWMTHDDGATSWPEADDSFATGFGRAWVRNVQVAAGQTVDVGYVVTGVDREVDAPSFNDVAVYQGGTSYDYYWFDFWSTSPWGMAHRSGTKTSRSYTARLANQDHYVKVYGRNQGGSWVVLQNWQRNDFNARPLDVNWTRAVQNTGTTPIHGFTLYRWREAMATRVVFRRYVSGAANNYRWVNGNSFRAYVVPGYWSHYVQAQYNISEYLVTQRTTQYSNVN